MRTDRCVYSLQVRQAFVDDCIATKVRKNRSQAVVVSVFCVVYFSNQVIASLQGLTCSSQLQKPSLDVP